MRSESETIAIDYKKELNEKESLQKQNLESRENLQAAIDSRNHATDQYNELKLK